MTIKRQALAVVLGGTMLLGTAGVSAAITPTEKSSVSLTVDAAHTELLSENTVLGDVNGDGYADIADALFIARVDALIVGLAEDMVKTADVNGDGFVDIADALMIARYDARLIESLSVDDGLSDGKLIEHNEQFGISDSRIEKMDNASRTTMERITYTLKNIKKNGDKGTADITVYSPDVKSALYKSVEEANKTLDINDNDVLEKSEEILVKYIRSADLKEYNLSVEIQKSNGKWSIVPNNELADALSGGASEFYEETFGMAQEE